MKRFKTTVIAVSSLSLCISSCTKGLFGHESESSEPILFEAIIEADVVDSKAASLYGPDNIITNDEGAFAVMAYNSKTGGRHFNEFNRVNYFHDVVGGNNRWRFYEGGDYIERYWPITYNLDFFAYMPYDLTKSCVEVEIDNKSFSCTLPLSGTEQDKIQEFVFAGALNRSSETNGGKVNLTFVHPFSAISFRLGKAHGNTQINSVGITGIAYKGTFDYKNIETNTHNPITLSNWNPDDQDKKELSVTVGKTVGASDNSGIQLDSPIGGPYLVLPQELETAKVKVSFKVNESDSGDPIEVDLQTTTWEPGKHYTYILNLGDNNEDIITDVVITDWTYVKDKNDIIVE